MSFRDRVRPALRELAPYHLPPARAAVELDANESPYPPPAGLLDALAEAVRDAHLERYPDPSARALRDLVAADLGQPPERLVFGNGSDDLIGLLCQCFAAPQQDGRPGAVAVPGPSFVVFRTAALAAGLRYVEPLLGPRFEADPAALEAALCAERPNLVFIATPNNPTGTVWPRPALEALLEAHPETVFIIDEAYAAYARQSHLDLIDRYEHCAILRTYSKVGLAALRIGVLVGRAELCHEVEKVRPPYNLGLLPQLAGALALGPFRAALGAHVETIIAERERLALSLLAFPALEVFPSGANLLLLRHADPDRLFFALLERGILVRNLHRPGPLAGCLRVTVGTPEENTHFLRALAEVL